MENYSNNKILNKLIEKGEYSEEELKRIYHEYCKLTHPDITGKNSEEFHIIQKEYRDAKKYLTLILKISDGKENINPRIMFHKLLYSYNIYGIHNSKIRNKPELKVRNKNIIQKLIFWSNLYDPYFSKIFIEYNKKHIKDFNGFEEEAIFKKGRDLFLKGLNFFLEYQAKGKIGSQKSSLAYLNETIFELNLISYSSLRQSILIFAEWLIKELDKPSSLFLKE